MLPVEYNITWREDEAGIKGRGRIEKTWADIKRRGGTEAADIRTFGHYKVSIVVVLGGGRQHRWCNHGRCPWWIDLLDECRCSDNMGRRHACPGQQCKTLSCNWKRGNFFNSNSICEHETTVSCVLYCNSPTRIGSEALIGLHAAHTWWPGARISGFNTSIGVFLTSI